MGILLQYDGHSGPPSWGATMNELADKMIGFGAVEAMNLVPPVICFLQSYFHWLAATRRTAACIQVASDVADVEARRADRLQLRSQHLRGTRRDLRGRLSHWRGK